MKISKKIKSKTNWEKLELLSENQIQNAAQSDEDALPLTDEELKKFKKINVSKVVHVKRIRHKLHLSQKVIEMEPKAVQRALSSIKKRG